MRAAPFRDILQQDVPLAELTTLRLGGKAQFFAACTNAEQINEALRYARQQGITVTILGGGSNIVFPDDALPGLVLNIRLRGISVFEGTPTTVTAAAGEPWDEFVRFCIDYDLTGLECLSGIPGLVGATPIQNVGAYGQEVAETIQKVTAIDRETLESVEFSGPACEFGYRTSRFKSRDAGRYIITGVTFALHRHAPPVLRYPELHRYLEAQGGTSALQPDRPALLAVRAAVLALRRNKSMVIDPADPDTRSAGSFFVNPILSKEAGERLSEAWRAMGHTEPIPTFPAENGVKIPAAWLVEQAGFPRGYRRGGVGVSAHHALALVNYAGTARELLELADDIAKAVNERFGITLEREPVVVSTHPRLL